MKEEIKTIAETENTYQTLSLMLGKNHGGNMRVICGGWNENTKKGNSFVEHNFPNAYLPKKFTDIKTHTKKQDMLDHVNFLSEIIAKQITDEPEPDTPFETLKHYYITAHSFNKVESVLIESTPIGILMERNNCCVTVIAKHKFKNKKYPLIYIDVTDDPTLQYAGGVVSMGYYVYRIEIRNAIILNDNPLMIGCKDTEIKRQYNRPCRRPM